MSQLSVPVCYFLMGFVATGVVRAKGPEFFIRKILPKFVSIPDYQYSDGPSGRCLRGGGRSQEFLALEVEFSYQPQVETMDARYVDDLLFTYYIFLNTRTLKYPNGILLIGSVTHTAVHMQREMHSVMCVSPATLDRFFQDRVPFTIHQTVIDVGGTISKEGQLLAFQSWKSQGTWWKNYQQISGFVLNKDQAPFVPLHWGDYEQIKPMVPNSP